MANDFKLFRLSSAVFILSSVGLLMFLSAACSNRSTTKPQQADADIRVLQKQLGGLVMGVSFSPDGKILASGNAIDKIVRLWDVASGQELRILEGHSKLISGVAFSPDGKTLASGSLDNTLKLWTVANGKEMRTLNSPQPVISVAFSSDRKTLAGGSIGMTKLWDVASGKELHTLPSKSSSLSIYSVAFSPDGKTLATVSETKVIELWDVASGKQLNAP
jgi:WD40 repeat protein